jgi:TonB family protein
MMRVIAVLIACVRHWTRIYTWRLPPAIRDARREEIESDLWESAHDMEMTQRALVIQMVMRLGRGIPDDLAWRSTQVTVPRSATLRLTAAGVVSLLLVVAISRLTTDVPHLPEAPLGDVPVHRGLPAPPPPPPPAPAALPGGEPIFQYGRASYSVVTQGPPPVRIKDVQPVYPPIALAAGLEGHVLVSAKITERGRVTDAEVAPAGILGQSAIDAVQRWEFNAASDGAQRPALLTVRVSFARSQ